MDRYDAPVTALVTFAIYDEAPIACQGDDDQRKIRVVSQRMPGGADVHARALHCAIAMMVASGVYVQVWQVASEPAYLDNLFADRLAPAIV